VAYLVIQTGNKPASRRRLDGAVEIGRGVGPEVWIEDKSASRTHCRIFQQNDSWVIEDLQSTNGTFINGARIQKQPLRDGEVILLGNTKIVFHLEDLQEDRPSRPSKPSDLSDSKRIDLNATVTHAGRPLPKVAVQHGEKPVEQTPRKSIAFERPPATPIVPPKPVEEPKKSWWKRLRRR
jgi:pSer/pThr/pTyr-binding forkhead associated (FHA) protein